MGATAACQAVCCQEKRPSQDAGASAKTASAWSEEAVSPAVASVKMVESERFDTLGGEGGPTTPFSDEGDDQREDEPPWRGQAVVPPSIEAASASGDVPEGEMLMVIERSASDIIGISLDIVDGISLVVVAIMLGAVKTWNDAHPGDLVLEVNDRIMAANSVRGDAHQLLAELKRSMRWNLSVCRPEELRVALERESLVARGRDLRYAASSTSLVISEIEGAFLQWNQRTPGAQISLFDRIVEMNGVRGSAQELLAAASIETDHMDVVILHYGP